MPKKLTETQVIACNMIDKLNDRSKDFDNMSDKEQAAYIQYQFAFGEELRKYKKTGDRKYLKLVKKDLEDVYNIVKKALEEWTDE